ncbi:MAG: hypothetical protein ACK4F5_11125 [Aliihoeflea sp.]
MEMMWPVLAIMLPLFAGGLLAVFMYWWNDPVGTDHPAGGQGRLAETRATRNPQRRPRFTPITMTLGFAGLAVAIMLALTIGFPLVRTVLMALHVQIDPG